jgi:hypothetical protein
MQPISKVEHKNSKHMKLKNVFFVAALAVLFSSCSVTHQGMREPNARVEFEKGDFEFSPQVTGTATSTKILGIDFSRLFDKKTASVKKDGMAEMVDLASIPVIGNYARNTVYNYALYDMISKNTGYDVVFYPSYAETVSKPIGIGFIYKITTVEVKAKLAKIKN